jgi:hypothetical protein
MLRVSWGIFQLAVGSAQTSKTREKVKALLKNNPNLGTYRHCYPAGKARNSLKNAENQRVKGGTA